MGPQRRGKDRDRAVRVGRRHATQPRVGRRAAVDAPPSRFPGATLRLWRSRKPELSGERGRLAARPHIQLGENRGHVVIDGLLRDEKPARDICVAPALGQQHDHFKLTARESMRVLFRALLRTSRYPARAASAELPSRGASHRPRAQLLENRQGRPQRALDVRIGKGHGLFVGASKLGPGAGRLVDRDDRVPDCQRSRFTPVG